MERGVAKGVCQSIDNELQPHYRSHSLGNGNGNGVVNDNSINGSSCPTVVEQICKLIGTLGGLLLFQVIKRSVGQLGGEL